MQLSLSTWQEIEDYLKQADGVIVPTGSIEQHGPIGLIGTDMLCANDIAVASAERANAVVVPPLGYAPAPFNMSFPGTLSVQMDTYFRLVKDVVEGLVHHGFRHIYVLNGHGANIEPIKKVLEMQPVACRLRSWWDFEPVNVLRRQWYGDWEGMHATPSEIAITQSRHRIIEGGDLEPPEKLSATYIRDHAGDRHGPAEEHRKQFPDGRVGSHSALVRPDHGQQLYDAAVQSVTEDYAAFLAL